MNTLFEKIIAGEIPSYKVCETEHSYAFLTIEPCAPGHTLVVPKKPVDKWTELTHDELATLMNDASFVAKKLERIFAVQRVGVIIAGFMVPHVHVHLVPCESEHDLRLESAHKASTEELSEVHNKVTSSWSEQ